MRAGGWIGAREVHHTQTRLSLSAPALLASSPSSQHSPSPLSLALFLLPSPLSRASLIPYPKSHSTIQNTNPPNVHPSESKREPEHEPELNLDLNLN